MLSLFRVSSLIAITVTENSRSATSFGQPTTSHNGGNGEPQDDVFDPGSPTDEDEAPPSPIASSHSAQPRIQASPRYQLGASARKRSSDSSGTDYGNSPKLTRTSKGKQPAYGENAPDSSPPTFKKPWLPESFTGVPNHGSSSRIPHPAVDSFASTVNTSFNTTSSSQQTVVNTPETSFASDAYDGDVLYPKLTRTSSTTLGSCKDQFLLDVEDLAAEAQIQREQRARMEELEHLHSSQDIPPRSSSAYGSVDEDAIYEKSFEVENGPAATRQSLTRFPTTPDQNSNIRRMQKPSAEPSVFNRLSRQAGERNAGSAVGVDAPREDTPLRNHKTVNEKTLQQIPQTLSKACKTSPSKLPHYIRAIPDQNLFSPPLIEDLKRFPYFVLFICLRLASEHSKSMNEVLQDIEANNAMTEPLKFLEQVCMNLNLPYDALRDQQKYWSASKRAFRGYTFKARIDYNDLDLGKFLTIRVTLTM